MPDPLAIPRHVAPPQEARHALADAGFADACELMVAEPGLDALTAVQRILGRPPAAIAWLMRLRNRIVAPFGLKPVPDPDLPPETAIGSFPVISRSAEEVVLGTNDRHLDFRIVVTSIPDGGRQRRVTVTTLVAPHNLWGRVYLALVMPFHCRIVPAMLAQAARP